MLGSGGMVLSGVEDIGCGDSRLLRIRPLDTVAGLALSGEVDITNRHLLTAALEPYLGAGTDLCLELSGLSFIDVGGMTVLNGAAQRLAPELRLVLRHPPRIVRRVALPGWSPPDNVEFVDP